MLRHPAAGVARQLRVGVPLRIVGGAPRFTSLSPMTSASVASTPRYLQRFSNLVSRPGSNSRFYHAQSEPAPSRWPRFVGFCLFLAGGGAATYWLADNWLADRLKPPTSAQSDDGDDNWLADRLTPPKSAQSDEGDDNFRLWLSLMEEMPPGGCAKEFHDALLYAIGMDEHGPDHPAVPRYPTKAVHHFILGLQLLGDVHDATWEKVCDDIISLLVAGFLQSDDWESVCDLVARTCSHLETRAAAKLEDGARHGGSIDDDARRENRRLFLQDAVSIPYQVVVVYQKLEAEKTIRALQSSPQSTAMLPATPDWTSARASRVGALLDRAVDIVLRELPSSSEYASHPEKLDFLCCYQRSSLFFVQAGIRASHGDTIAEAFYLMQCMYQIPQNAETATLELASAAYWIAKTLARGSWQKLAQALDQVHQEMHNTFPPHLIALHPSLEQLRALQGKQLAALSIFWSQISIDAVEQLQSSPSLRAGAQVPSPSPAAQQEAGPTSQTGRSITFPGTGTLDLERMYLKSVLLRAMGWWTLGSPFEARREVLAAMERAEARGVRYTEQEKFPVRSIIESLEKDIEARGLKLEDEKKFLASTPGNQE